MPTPHSYVEVLDSSVAVCGVGTSNGEQFRLNVGVRLGPSSDRISVLSRKDTREKVVIFNPKGKTSPDTNPTRTLTLDFQPPEL